MARMETIRTIDAWAQPAFPASRMPDAQRIFGRLLQQSGSAALDRAPTADEMVAMMDAAGIAHVLLSAWSSPHGFLITNDEVAAFCEKHPDRFSGVAAVDLATPVEAVRELRRAVSELGFKALRVIPWLWSLPPNDRAYWPLYVACVELGVPFCTQAGHTGPLMPSDTGRPIPYLDEVALTFPDLKIVAGHIGYPWTDEMIGLAWKHEHVYIDTSAYLPRYYPPQLVHFANTYGRDKVLFGSNFPQLDWARCARQVADLPLADEARAAFLQHNAMRVFGLS